MKNSLTIVLPTHNGESRLRSNVQAMLELASELTDRFSVLIVDDGSIDDTFEVASELASEFPQVSVKRLSSRRGLGRAIESIRARVKSDVVVVHDGVSSLDVDQVRRLWQLHTMQRNGGPASSGETPGTGIRDFAGISETHSALVQAHKRVSGFQLIPSLGTSNSEELAATAAPPASKANPTTPAKPFPVAHDMGCIPALPRPNFMEVLTDFALGE